MTTAELTTQSLLPKSDDLRTRVQDALAGWHAEHHTGSVQHCYEQPCHLLTRALDGGSEDHSQCLSMLHDCADECPHECRRCGADKVCPAQAEHDAKTAENIKRLSLAAKP